MANRKSLKHQKRILGALALAIVPFAAPSSNAADLILNEYNAVSATNKLDGGNGADTFFGSINGNGGNWFELVVVTDHLDIRNWKLEWTEKEEVTPGVNAAGALTLGSQAIWSDLRSGTVLTFIETPNAEGVGNFNTATDISYNPAANDWWINVSTQEEATKGASALVTTTTNDGNPGQFSVGKDDWQLTIRNAGGNLVFGPSGEGGAWKGDGVGSEEVGSLEGPLPTPEVPVNLQTWQAIGPDSVLYDDSSSSSFGGSNVSYDRVSGKFTPEQDLSALRAVIGTPSPSGDFNNDGLLSSTDIDLLTAAVRAGSTDTKFDLNKNSTVDAQDRTVWVESLKKTYFGDADLDGQFNSTDLIAVLSAGQYEDAVSQNSTWATGDWDGDAEFTTSDLVAALQGGGYDAGPRAAVSAVPEPAGWLAGCLYIIGLLTGRRRRQCNS